MTSTAQALMEEHVFLKTYPAQLFVKLLKNLATILMELISVYHMK
jgi:hypothetical protein